MIPGRESWLLQRAASFIVPAMRHVGSDSSREAAMKGDPNATRLRREAARRHRDPAGARHLRPRRTDAVAGRGRSALCDGHPDRRAGSRARARGRGRRDLLRPRARGLCPVPLGGAARVSCGEAHGQPGGDRDHGDPLDPPDRRDRRAATFRYTVSDDLQRRGFSDLGIGLVGGLRHASRRRRADPRTRAERVAAGDGPGCEPGGGASLRPR